MSSKVNINLNENIEKSIEDINRLEEEVQKLYHIKKNFKLCMETKDCQGIRQRNINDIDKAERDIRPKIAPITKVSQSADRWLKQNMDIDIRKDIGEDDYDYNKNNFYNTVRHSLNIKKEKNEIVHPKKNSPEVVGMKL